MLVKNKTDWYNARKICNSLGGDLTAFGQQSDMGYVATWVNTLVKLKKAESGDFTEIWIGLTTKPGIGNFVDTNPDAWFWVGTGAKPTFTAWASGYPSHRYQECGSLVVASKQWQNNRCGPDMTGMFAVTRPYLCEIGF